VVDLLIASTMGFFPRSACARGVIHRGDASCASTTKTTAAPLRARDRPRHAPACKIEVHISADAAGVDIEMARAPACIPRYAIGASRPLVVHNRDALAGEAVEKRGLSRRWAPPMRLCVSIWMPLLVDFGSPGPGACTGDAIKDVPKPETAVKVRHIDRRDREIPSVCLSRLVPTREEVEWGMTRRSRPSASTVSASPPTLFHRTVPCRKCSRDTPRRRCIAPITLTEPHRPRKPFAELR